MKYLLVRITAGTNFTFAKGNVKIYTNTIFKNDDTKINYKMYDSTVNFIEGDADLKPFIITDGYKNGGSVSVSNNDLTLATPTATSINTYGVMKKYNVGEHKAGHIVINGTTCSNTGTTKLVMKFNADSPNLIQFYNKEGKRINTPNVAGSVDKLVSEFSVNRFFNIPSDCEFILFGVGGYGSNYQYPITFTINDYYLELI